MPRIAGTVTLLAALLGGPTAGQAADLVEHELEVEIDLAGGTVRVEDRITLPPGVAELVLTRRAREAAWKPAGVREVSGDHGPRRFSIPEQQAGRLELAYTLPLAPLADGQTGSGTDGLVWDGRGPWYADAPGRLHAFTLAVTVPRSWRTVSQGARLRGEEAAGGRREVWRETQPQQEIHLIAGPFTEYVRETGDIQAMAFLRRPDDALADKYLAVTGRYIEVYERLIGEYPYAKFALVENTWESGYGMPSFTLLGPRVIRLPFIPYTSYPHEILHNWWGNSVYVDPEQGNWSEGLTAYLADHRLKAQRGEGALYRRDALQKYLSFVSSEKDFPLAGFRARHDETSQAVGYGKSMMLFHMLRRRLGDDLFFEGLRRFYREYRFTAASFADLRRVFESVSGRALERFFGQWVARTGAPRLVLEDVEHVARDGGFVVRGRLRQVQDGDLYHLVVPVSVDHGNDSSRHAIELDARVAPFELALDRRPAGIAVDPDFDVFRRLDPGEVPPSLGEAYGAARLSFVIPEDAGEAAHAAWRSFIGPWREAGREVRVLTDTEPWPDTGAVWILGWDNARRGRLEASLDSHRAGFDDGTLSLAGERLGPDATVVLAARGPDGRPLLWSHLADADPTGTAERLRHYGRVSYVAFEDGRPVARGQWPVLDSPLAVRFTPPAPPLREN